MHHRPMHFIFCTANVLLLILSVSVVVVSADEKSKDYVSAHDAVLGLMANLGAIIDSSERGQESTGLKTVRIVAANGTVEIESLKDGSIQSITRTAKRSVDNRLKWERSEVIKKASYYIEKIFCHKVNGEPVLITQENLDGSRNLWSVGWSRNIKGYPMRDDFVTVTFDETEGLFGFAYSWQSPIPQSIPEKPLTKVEAAKSAQAAAKQVMEKFSSKFSSYRLGNVVVEELMIVAPNYALSNKVKSELDLLNGDTKNPRLVWAIGYKVEVNPSVKASTIVDASGLTVWIDAETGACIGAAF